MRKDYIFVTVQLLLFGLIALIGKPHFETSISITLFGLFTIGLGFLICIISLLQINRNLSIFPTPLEKGELITSGIYGYIRHPIYLGVLFIAFGWSLYTYSISRLICSLLLLILFYFKSDYEEKLLRQKFEGYEIYMKKTGKILPWL